MTVHSLASYVIQNDIDVAVLHSKYFVIMESEIPSKNKWNNNLEVLVIIYK